jgi:hypothetical protein
VVIMETGGMGCGCKDEEEREEKAIISMDE